MISIVLLYMNGNEHTFKATQDEILSVVNIDGFVTIIRRNINTKEVKQLIVPAHNVYSILTTE